MGGRRIPAGRGPRGADSSIEEITPPYDVVVNLAGGDRPVLRRHLGVTAVPGEGAYLLCEHGSAVLEDPADAGLVARLAGSAPGPVDPAALRRLERAGLLAPPGAPVPDREAGYWHSAGLPAPSPARVVLHVEGAVDADEARGALAAAGLSIEWPAAPTATTSPLLAGLPTASAGVPLPTGAGTAATLIPHPPGPDPLHLVLTDDLARADVAGKLAAEGATWLLAKPVGVRVAVGPVFTPDGPCHACLAHVLTARSPSRRYLTHRTGAPPALPVVDLAATRLLAYGLVATAARQWLAGHRAGGGAVRVLDTVTWRLTHHPVRRRPQCPACGEPGLVAARMTAPVVVAARPASAHRDGGWRAEPAADVLARYGGLADALTGVVDPLTPVAPGLPFLHAYTAGPNPAVRVSSLRDLRAGLRAFSCGKGDTDGQARASALGEALERASAVWAGDEPVRRATLAQLGDDAIAPNAVQLYSGAQFAGRAAWNARDAAFQHVCDPLPPDVTIDWSPLWSLTHDRLRWLPTSLLFFGHREPGPAYAWADSNGCAAGASVEDALLQGLFELIERDAVAIWWYNRLRRPGLDLAALRDPAVARRLDAHAGLGRQLWALDVTSDLGVPVVVAVSARPGPRPDVLFGFGAHTDARIALGRALAEVDQFLPAVAGARDDGTGYGSQDPDQLRWWRTARLADHPHLVPHGPDRPLPPSPLAPDLGAEVTRLRGLLEARGLEVLALDMTRPDIGLPAVRAVVPGLRHFWARFAPGRLYDVPVALGERAGPLPEAALNPIPVFL